MKQTADDFIESRQELQPEFVKIFTDSLIKSKALQYLLKVSFATYPDMAFDKESIEKVLYANTKNHWAYLYDPEGADKMTSVTTYFPNGAISISITQDNPLRGFNGLWVENINTDRKKYDGLSVAEKQWVAEKSAQLKQEAITEFYNNPDNQSLYNELADFEDFEYTDNKSFRYLVKYTDAFVIDPDAPRFKPLHIKNWTAFYNNIIARHFTGYKAVANNIKMIIYKKQINETLALEVEIDRKYFVGEFKYDKIEIPILRFWLVSGKEKYKLLIYMSHMDTQLASTNEDMQQVKPYVFLMLNSYFKLQRSILELFAKELK